MSECCQITADGWCATHSTENGPVYPPQYQRAARLQAILTDLIAELRSEWEMVTVQEAADRAEARLKEVQR